MMKDYQVVTVGDALIDIFMLPKKDGESFAVDHNDMVIHLGDKIAVDKSVMSLGGDASNVAVGLSRLGIKTALMAEIGDDYLSHMIRMELSKHNVSQEFIIQTHGAPSSFSVILSTGKERTILSHHIDRKHDFDFSTVSTEWLYLTSLGEFWHEAYHKAFAYVRHHNLHLAFNPGSHQLREGGHSFINILPSTHILFVNREEAEIIVYGKEFGEDEERPYIEMLLHDLQSKGPKIVSVTDGVHGSYAMDDYGEVYHQSRMPSHIIEKTGVGDAYAAAFLAAIIRGRDVPTAMRWGTANSANVMEHIGSTTGLLTQPELRIRMSS